MNGYVILTNGKRGMVALAHSIVFLAIALRGMAGAVRPWHLTSPFSGWIIPFIYLLVSSVLVLLTAFSGAALERLYFAFCTASAGFGLLRSVLGDPPMHLAVYVRVALLVCAVVTGMLILRAVRLARAAPAAPVTASPR